MRHQVVEIEATTIADCDVDVFGFGELADGSDLGDVQLIDESSVPTPILSEAMGTPATSRRLAASAVPTSQPMSPRPPSLPWGLGTDGWPRQNSRLVRLFACSPDHLLNGVAGLDWGLMHLTLDVHSTDADHWPRAVAGTLQMPYPSRPLDVEFRVQPFHDRYTRVDVILCSRHRWPRRYFDVASCCLTRMQILERPAAGR